MQNRMPQEQTKVKDLQDGTTLRDEMEKAWGTGGAFAKVYDQCGSVFKWDGQQRIDVVQIVGGDS